MITARRIGGSIVAIAAIASGFAHLFAGPGYEQSIAAGAVVPTVSAVVAAWERFDDRALVRDERPSIAIARGAGVGLAYAALSLAIAFAHGARAGFCDPWSGAWTYACCAGIGSVLAGVVGSAWGLAVGAIVDMKRRRRRLALTLAALSPLTTALVDLGLFFGTPAVFAYDPFVGFFSGTLYDEVVDAGPTLLTYRVGTLLTLASIALVARACSRRDGGDGSLVVTDRKALSVGLILGALSVAHVAFGASLGHRSSSAHVKAVLGGERHGARCDVVFPSGNDGDLLLRDCEESLAEVERRLGVRGPDRVTAFFFRDADQKRALMGAADTYVAKPWRREVYLQVAAYPHPVLGHELAHVVAGTLAHNPLHVAGKLGGLWVNPGLVEGIAVAASPDRDDLTARSWARAMRDLKILPPLGSVFGAGFLAQNASTAYTIAGAFVGLQLDRGRGAQLRAWYGGASFDEAFGRSFADAEAEFLASLDDVVMTPEALAVAKARFDRPGIWGRRCPHVVERLRVEASECRASGRLHDADEKLHALLRLDVGDPSARLDLARDAKLGGDHDRYLAGLVELANDARLGGPWRARASEALGDDALRSGSLDVARQRYLDAASRVVDEDFRRTLDVKIWATSSLERAHRIGRLLVGSSAPGDDTLASVVALSRAIEHENEPREDVAIARYLVARRLVDAKTWDDAEALLRDADPIALESISPRLRRERARLRLQIACAAPEAERSARATIAYADYLSSPPANDGRRLQVARLARRCGATNAP